MCDIEAPIEIIAKAIIVIMSIHSEMYIQIVSILQSKNGCKMAHYANEKYGN